MSTNTLDFKKFYIMLYILVIIQIFGIALTIAQHKRSDKSPVIRKKNCLFLFLDINTVRSVSAFIYEIRKEEKE